MKHVSNPQKITRFIRQFRFVRDAKMQWLPESIFKCKRSAEAFR